MAAEDRKFWTGIGVMVLSVVTAFILFSVFVLFPSYADRREDCAAVGGVIIQGGACVKAENVLRY